MVKSKVFCLKIKRRALLCDYEITFWAFFTMTAKMVDFNPISYLSNNDFLFIKNLMLFLVYVYILMFKVYLKTEKKSIFCGVEETIIFS